MENIQSAAENSILTAPPSLSSELYSLADFCARPRPEPPQTGKMTWPKILALINAGYGQGHLYRYKPWLRVTKHDYSPISSVGHVQSHIKGQLHHVRAGAEASAALVLYWLGACDLRDQYPIWPWPHDHLASGLDPQVRLPRLPGLLEIADEAGINHGYFPGTNLPYVATLDLVSTWCTEDGGYRFIAHECKPREFVYDPNPLSRVKERLELSRRYLKIAQVPQHLLHIEDYPKLLFVNLNALRPGFVPKHQTVIRASHDYSLLLDQCKRRAYEQPLNAVLTELARKTTSSLAELLALSHLAIWHQDLDHDPSKPFEPWRRLHPGGIALKARLRREWTGFAS